MARTRSRSTRTRREVASTLARGAAATSCRCQRTSVAGETRNDDHADRGNKAAEGGEQQPVARPQPRTRDLTPYHLEVLAQEENLKLLRPLQARAKHIRVGQLEPIVDKASAVHRLDHGREAIPLQIRATEFTNPMRCARLPPDRSGAPEPFLRVAPPFG
jgi:hypothetical protein